MKKIKESIVLKSIFGIVVMLVIFSVSVSIIGYKGFTDALLKQYNDGALLIAKTAAMGVDADKTDSYLNSGGKTEEYKKVWDSLNQLCNSSNSTFIYVIQPDLTDYAHITFMFSTINQNSSYKVYEFGYVRETTNEEYRQKYKALYENTSTQEIVIRDKGYIETDTHITAMLPLKDSHGNTQAILCVQKQMAELTAVRHRYIGYVLLLFILLALIVVIVQTFYLYRVFLMPMKNITEEAGRFAAENTLADKKLTDIIHQKDEIGILAGSIDRMEEQILSYVDNITKITAEKERISIELSLATKIQASMLPNATYPERDDFDIFASMTPAKDVGGDFYDFFLIDDDHLGMIMADVSGKGIPAALFMMASKILLHNFALEGFEPSEVLTKANEQICKNNKTDMFVTVWYGILEISTGKVKAANAGHEYPALSKNGKFDIFKDKHGFVLGGMEGVKYREYEFEMEHGDILFLYTDGVPEATNSKNEMFGNDRMIAALNIDAETSSMKITDNVKSEVDKFVGSAEQFDDLTMLCVKRI